MFYFEACIRISWLGSCSFVFLLLKSGKSGIVFGRKGRTPCDTCGVCAGGKTSLTRCMELALLRLQDIWLGKVITSGLLVPAGRLCIGLHGMSSSGVVGTFTVLLAYAIIGSGHLPLMVIVICLAMMKMTLLAAVSWDAKFLEYQKRLGIARPCVILTQVSATMVLGRTHSYSNMSLATFSTSRCCNTDVALDSTRALTRELLFGFLARALVAD